jgi:hypothetical protein
MATTPTFRGFRPPSDTQAHPPDGTPPILQEAAQLSGVQLIVHASGTSADRVRALAGGDFAAPGWR